MANRYLEETLKSSNVEEMRPVDPHIFKITKALKEDAGIDEIALLCQESAEIAGGLMKLATNAAYQAHLDEKSTILDVVNVIGMDKLIPEVMKYSNMARRPNADEEVADFSLMRLWERIVVNSVAAAHIQKSLFDKMNGGHEMGLIASLNSYGIRVLYDRYPEEYKRVLVAREKNSSRLTDEEKKVFGITNNVFAGNLMKAWGFPEMIYKTVKNSHIRRFPRGLYGEEKEIERRVKVLHFASSFRAEVGYQGYNVQEGLDPATSPLKQYFVKVDPVSSTFFKGTGENLLLETIMEIVDVDLAKRYPEIK